MQDSKSKSKKFIEELNNRKSCDKLFNADRDLESLIAMRDRRVSKHGLTMVESFFDIGECYESNSYRDNRYVVSHEKMHMQHKISFKKNNHFLYQHDSYRINAEADIIDLLDSSKIPSEAYICPNCGGMSNTKDLSSVGCLFCGAQFSVPQLYPKISYFSYTEAVTDLNKEVPRRIKWPLLICWLLAYIPLYFLGFVIWEEYGFLAVALYDIAMIAIAAIPAYFLYAILTYFVSVKTMYDDSIQRRQKRDAERRTTIATDVFEKMVSKYSSVFNFQYFSSRIYNLLGMMIFAEDKKECPFYSGPNFVGYFDTIIEYVPIGMDILSFSIDEKGKCTIGAKVIADAYAYVDNKILYRKADFILNTSKNMNYPIDINFSVHTYKCDGCGANFDVTKSDACPFCGRPNAMLDEEWYIDGAVKGVFRK